jgi:hypothetical protein
MLLAVLTIIDEPTAQRSPHQWQGVTGALTSDAQVAAGISPLVTMRKNAASLAKTKLGKQMCQFVAQRSINFRGPEFLQSWI